MIGELLIDWEDILSRFFRSLPDAAMVTDLQGSIELVNDKMLRLVGISREEAIGHPLPYPWLLPQAHSNALPPLAGASPAEGGATVEGTVTDAEGNQRIVEFSITALWSADGEPQRLLSIARDITLQRRSDELLQAEKMNAVSQLASGVAHDINNNLAVIQGYSEYLLGRSMNLDEVERHALDAIQKQAQECAETVRRIQLFARPVPKSTFTLVSVNDVVRDLAESSGPAWRDESGLGGGVRLETDLNPVPPVLAHQVNLKEALTNLINNAAAAVAEEGIIRLRTSCSGSEVVVEVMDNGVGIDPRHMNRIFDPFFTTKGPASSGLGLSIAHNLVTQQGGTLSAASVQGKGTTFTLRFPAAQGDQPAPTITSKPRPSARYLEVLVVDDEPLVAGMIRTLLESVGHRVTVCLSGAEAVDAFRNEVFDLAIVDLAMPQMDGWEVSRSIKRLRPDFPVIVATGWSITVEDGEDRGVAVNAVLNKPFGLRELTGAIESATQSS